VSAWQKLISAGILAPIDLRFAHLMRRKAGVAPDLIGLTAALLSYERAKGNACIRLADWAGRRFPSDNTYLPVGQEPELPVLPALDEWTEALRTETLIGDGHEPTPLVLEDGKLFLYRYRRAERELAAFIAARMETPEPVGDGASPDLLMRLFPAIDAEPDWQAAAVLAAVHRRFAIISGGPGTGKTTTVVRLLAMLLHAEPDMRIALAAPTGKAASRLAESISGQVSRLPVDDALRDLIPTEVVTLHRLLGYLPRRDRFRHNRGNPLFADMVIIDEASMVDLLLMARLTSALTDSCRLVLIGDHNQLASVDTGYVLGDITRAAQLDRGHSQGFGETYHRFTGHSLPGCEAAVAALRDSVVVLEKSYRFGADSGIGALSRAVRERDPDAVIGALEGHDDVTRRDPPAAIDEALTPLIAHLHRCMEARTVEDALARLGKGQILCGLRNGPSGVTNLNAAVERLLIRNGFDLRVPFYRGRPILITRNDYQNKLYNGDIGIVWIEAGRTRAHFSTGGEIRALPVSQLPAHETAWAMTVHKNQGSEFDHVLFFLPEAEHPICNRELFYTGITRAKTRLDLIGDLDAVRAATVRGETRHTGLADLLR